MVRQPDPLIRLPYRGFYGDDVPSDEFELRDEAHYHFTFTNFSFPQLEAITFLSSTRGHLYNKTSLLSQYLQTNLKSFRGFGCTCKGGADLSDQFFSSMKVQYHHGIQPFPHQSNSLNVESLPVIRDSRTHVGHGTFKRK